MHVICRGGAHDNERYPLPSAAAPGHVFRWEGCGTGPYRILPEIVHTNRGPMWVATPAGH
jgi:hypothetical protein